MAFSEIERKRIENTVGGMCQRRNRPEMHDKLRLEYSVDRHDVELYEVRPHWQDPTEELHTSCAKLKFVRTAGEWRLFWMRKDLRWHAYEPLPASRSLEELVAEVARDRYGCFFG